MLTVEVLRSLYHCCVPLAHVAPEASLTHCLPRACGVCVSPDLEEIGDLEGYIQRTTIILIYCSKGYFTSKNCMRELVASKAMQKPIIALIDPDESRGGLSLEAVKTQLLEANDLCVKWGFRREGQEAGPSDGLIWPGGEALYGHLFADSAIEWNRIGHFQDVRREGGQTRHIGPLRLTSIGHAAAHHWSCAFGCPTMCAGHDAPRR